MKYKKVLQLVKKIAEREMADFDGGSWLDYCFPNPDTIPFLAKMLCLKKPFKMMLVFQGVSVLDFNNLGLHKNGKEWYLGYYPPDGTKDFQDFQHFFRMIRARQALYFTDEKGAILLTQYTARSRALLHAKTYITSTNDFFDYAYGQDFIEVLARWSNKGVRLKMIVADCKGNFHVTHGKIWLVDVPNTLRYVEFENTQHDARLPNEIRRGEFIDREFKIVQIQYKNRILYSTESFTEEEMEKRDNYWEKELQRFIDLLRG